MSSVTLRSKASMPQSAPPTHWAVSLLWCPAGFGGQQAVCVVPSGLCRPFPVQEFSSALPASCIPPQASLPCFYPSFCVWVMCPPPICPVPCLPFFLISSGFLLLWIVSLPYQHQQIFLTPKSSSFSDFYVLCRAVFIDCRMPCLSKRLLDAPCGPSVSGLAAEWFLLSCSCFLRAPKGPWRARVLPGPQFSLTLDWLETKNPGKCDTELMSL